MTHASDKATGRVYVALLRVEAEGRKFPTTRELAAQLGYSLATTHACCARLFADGKVDKHAGWGIARAPQKEHVLIRSREPKNEHVLVRYVCECGAAFLSERSLLTHQIDTHADEDD